MLGQMDRSQDLHRIGKDGRSITVSIKELEDDGCKAYISRVLSIADRGLNGFGMIKRSETEYDNKPWIDIQREQNIIRWVNQYNSKEK